MARVRSGAIGLPPPIYRFCTGNQWTLFRMTALDDDRLEIQPVLPGDDSDFDSPWLSSLAADGQLWIPQALREVVSLGDQSVMVRVEEGVIRIYLRKVFETLGFRP